MNENTRTEESLNGMLNEKRARLEAKEKTFIMNNTTYSKTNGNLLLKIVARPPFFSESTLKYLCLLYFYTFSFHTGGTKQLIASNIILDKFH